MMTKAMVLAGALALAIAAPAHAQIPKTDPGTNNPPPAGAILDLSGTPIPGGGNNTYQQYTVEFTATLANTAITFAFREDPAYISFANASVTDLTTSSGNLLVNGDFSGGSSSWTYANQYGAYAGGVVVSNCGVGLPGGTYGVGNCWYDGAVQAYDAISQTIPTNPGDTYLITFWVADNSSCSTDGGGPSCSFSDLSTNGDATDTGGNGINVTVYAQAGVPANSVQTAPPQPVTPGGTNQVQFNSATNNLVQHNLTWASNLQFNNGVTNPQLLSSNIILSTDPSIAPFLKFTPWAVAQLFEKAGDDQVAGGTGFGSLYRDKCFQFGSDPSTATEQNCPVGANPGDFIFFSDVFDQPDPKPDIAPGTTVSLIHHPGTTPTNPQPSDTWLPVPSGATSNPVCTQVQTTGATFSCELEDDLTYDPATFATSPGGVSGDQTTIGGKNKGRGTLGSLFNVPMLETTVLVNTKQVNVPGVQGAGVNWFNSPTLNLEFDVNPATTSTPSNGWFAAPVQNLAYVFYSNSEPPLPDPPNCVTTGSTCVVKNGTPGAFTNGVAAAVGFIDSLAGVNDGLYTLAWSARDTVQIGERNIQLLKNPAATCPNPFGLIPTPTPPCYSTTLFSAQIGVDTTFPTWSCNSAPDSSWHAGVVSFNCSASDALSGLQSPVPELPGVLYNFTLQTPPLPNQETTNVSTNSLPQICDLANNCVTAGPFTGIKIDNKPPVIAVTVPAATTYAANQVVKAAYGCTDLGSGVASCVGTVPPGSNIDTAPNGVLTPKTFTVNSADNVGNVTTPPAIVNYSVSCHYAAVGISPSSVKRPAWITVTSSVIDCVPAAQTVSLKYTLSGPLGKNCGHSSEVMFTTKPFTIKSGTSSSISFPFPIFKNVCAGTYTVTTTTLQGTTILDSVSSALLVN